VTARKVKAPAKKSVASPKKKKATAKAENPPVKSQPTYDTKFTKTELVHLRDLFSVFLPPNGEHTVSEALAKVEGRVIAERLLYEKIVALCVKAKLPVGEAAPDHTVGFAANPNLGVFPFSSDEVEEDDSEETDLLTSLFEDED
jgi:hypothetical protein